MSDYCVRADVEDIYGADNVSEWANLDNDGNATNITNRIAARITDASQEVDEYLNGTHYHIPLATFAGITPRSIKRITAMLVGVMLYECGRGVEDMRDGEPVHQLMWARQSVYQQLADIASGKRQIGAM